MKQDRAITAIGLLTAFMGLLMLSVGRFILGGIVMLLAFGIFWTRGGGKFNDRSIYEKIIRTDLGIDELYEKIKDIDTPFGKPWIAGHKGYEGDSIVFGPGKFRDCVVISRVKGGSLSIKHLTLTENIIRGEEDEYRFSDLINTAEAEVTPERYAVFAGFKLASVMLVKHLMEIVEKLSEDRNAEVPDSLDFFTFYYHNSSDGYLRNSGGDEVLKIEHSYKPFRSAVLDADGNEMASVMPHAFDGKGIVLDTAGYEMFANGEHYGEIKRLKEGRQEGFICSTEEGEFRVNIFPSCMRAKVSCNYTVEHEGELKAVIGGSPSLQFDNEGWCRNDLILSYDDDYLVLYAILEIFILTLNSRFLK
ncbi:MAG: hypothetical protein MJ128_03345 [Mogibacterium sp.]|nr:hypothetical protein [Mogibacterium sp.]